MARPAPTVYPTHMEHVETLRDGSKMMVRPIRPADASLELAFVEGLSAESRYTRFFSAARTLSPAMLARFTQVDYVHELALIGIAPGEGPPRMAGVARYSQVPGSTSCEFAITVTDVWQKRGIAAMLMRRLIDAARDNGFLHMSGSVMSMNTAMRPLMRALGFSVHADPEDATLLVYERDLALEAGIA